MSIAKSKPVMLAILTICMLTIVIPLARADETTESFILYTDKTDYQVGETINIYAKAVAIDPDQVITVQNVTICDPNGQAVANWQELNIVLPDTTTPQLIGTVTATTEGVYTVNAAATGCPWWLYFTWHFFCKPKCPPQSVPELPFGTIAAAIALFGSTGLYIKKKKSNAKKA